MNKLFVGISDGSILAVGKGIKNRQPNVDSSNLDSSAIYFKHVTSCDHNLFLPVAAYRKQDLCCYIEQLR